MSASRRVQKMGSLMRSELARLLIEETSDPGLRGVGVNEVELTKDLRQARIYFSVASPTPVRLKQVEKAFHRAMPFMKRRLADNLQLRFVPSLSFLHDTHSESVARLYSLFGTATIQEQAAEKEASSDPVDRERGG